MSIIPIIKKCLGVKGTRFVRSISFHNKLQINKKGIKFTVNSKREYLFWILVKLGLWESETYYIMNKFLNKQHSYLDIGAWIGPTVLYGCQIAKHCYAIEPDHIAFQELTQNVELNKNIQSNITLANFAISDLSGTVRLYQSSGGWGQSTSSILSNEIKSSIDVESKTFQQFIDDYSISDCNFIKMDIEGAEFIVLSTMFNYLKRYRPTLLVEIHPMFVKDPIQKFETLLPVLNIYNHMYDEKFKEINIEYVSFLLKNKPNRTLQILLTDLP
jgi:FkbM family methyltransferase